MASEQREEAVRPAHVSGFCPEGTGQTDAAIEHLRKGARLAPTYAPIWEHLGLAYEKEGHHHDAVSAFERATKLLPGHNRLGNIWRKDIA